MRSLVFFLEEPSAREMLKGLLPKFVPNNIFIQYVVFEGKQDLEKRLPIKLRAWQNPESLFVVMRDQDNGDCVKIKSNLLEKAVNAGKPNTLIRIACHELESFYLGDLSAVASAIGPTRIAVQQKKTKFRTPDRLSNPAEELKKIAPSYQKVSGSRAIGPFLEINNNCSVSFNALVNGVQSLLKDVS